MKMFSIDRRQTGLTDGATGENSWLGEVSEGQEALGTAGREASTTIFVSLRLSVAL